MFNKFKENTTQLKDIEGLIKDKISGKVIKHEVVPLTAIGENYGSEILRVEITVDENGQQKIAHAVAKLIPPTEFQLQIFNTQVTFKNEAQFYAVIVPLMREIQREHHFSEIANYFPELYGSRFNLKQNSEVVDTDAVILMENLKLSGYDIIEPQKFFDLDTTRKILRALANLQATAVGLKLKRPEVFHAQIRPYLTEFSPPVFPVKEGTKDPLLMQFETALKENPNTAHLISKVSKVIAKQKIKKNRQAREPWATIVHNDLWVNNVMVKHTNHEVSEIKLVDFQVIDYGSPINDLIYFLLTSVQTSVLKYHFDKLILFYYNEFVKTLQQLKVDLKEFTYEQFQEELKLDVTYQLYHVFFMLGVVFAQQGASKIPGKVAEWNPTGQSNNLQNRNFASPNHAGPPKPSGPPDQIQGPPKIPMSSLAKEKLWFIVEEAAKRSWI